MVKKLESSVLKDMTLSDLKKHAKQLRRGGYPISGYSGLSDTPSDKSTLRKMIRKSQKAGKTSGSPKKSSSKASSPKSGCDSGFDNITKCQKKTSAKRVKELAEQCGIEYTNKEETCAKLMKIQGNPTGSGGSKKKQKTPGSTIRGTDAYKKLNKLKKKDNKGDDLQDVARKLKIAYGDQDGDNITMGKLRKHELIVAILTKKGGSPVKTPLKKKKKSKKKSPKKKTPKKTPTPPKKSKKRKKKTHTPSPPKSPPGFKGKLMEKSRSDLRKMLRKAGLTSFPKSKEDMVEYLWAANNNGRCDPEEGQWCDDEFVCDASNKPGVCLSPAQAAHHASSWDYNGKKIVGTSDAITALKAALKKKKKDYRPKSSPLPDPWSAKGLKRKKLINKVSLATGRSKSFYKDWTVKDLKDRLYGVEVEEDRLLTKTKEQAESDDREARRIMIDDIIEITGENASVYKGYDLDEVMNKLHQLGDDEVIEEADEESESSASEREPTPPAKKKKKTPTPDSSSSDEEESEPTPPVKKKKTKKAPTPESSSSSDESDRPDEDTEIVDVESTLANVIAGKKKIGELARVQKSILKCMGLLS